MTFLFSSSENHDIVRLFVYIVVGFVRRRQLLLVDFRAWAKTDWQEWWEFWIAKEEEEEEAKIHKMLFRWIFIEIAVVVYAVHASFYSSSSSSSFCIIFFICKKNTICRKHVDDAQRSMNARSAHASIRIRTGKLELKNSSNWLQSGKLRKRPMIVWYTCVEVTATSALA